MSAETPIPVGSIDWSSAADLRHEIQAMHRMLMKQAEIILGQSERIDELTGQGEPEKQERRAL